jgi:hypothetical protein
MKLKCPECGLTKARECLSWRLETCPACGEEGHEVYLTDASPTAGRAPTELAPMVRRFLEAPRGTAPQH